MKIGSLFSGIGGLELGLERAGVGHTVWQVEKDPYCLKVLERHWPDATRYTDITDIDWSTVEPVDVLCGGFPCQDISLAGTGAGLAGERSGLWREYARAIRVLRPRFVIVENVSALLARGLGDVLADLAACGYDTEWDCIPAAAVGAPHRRDRVFLLAYPDGESEPGNTVDAGPGPRIVVSGAEQRWHVVDTGSGRRPSNELRAGRDEPRLRRTNVADAASKRLERTDGYQQAKPEPAGPSPWEAEPDVGRVANGVPSRVDRLRALGNAVVPQVAEMVGRRLMELAA